MHDWIELLWRYDIWKILAGCLLGGVGKTLWDHSLGRQRLSDKVRREVRSQIAEYQKEASRVEHQRVL